MTTVVPKPAPGPLAPASPAVRRRRRWPRVLVLVVLLLTAAWLWLVPPLVRWIVIDRLHAAGFRDVSIAETKVGFGSVHASDVRLGRDGKGEVVVPGATAELTLGDLLAGRLGALVIDGPTWRMEPGAAGPFDDVVRRPRETGTAPVTALPELPVGKLTIRNGHVLYGEQSIALDAEIVASDTRWDLSLRAAGAGPAVQLTAQLEVAPARAHGAVTLQTAGERPIELRGTFRSEVVDGARVFDVELGREPAPFEVTVAATTWSGNGAIKVRAHVPLANLAAAVFDVMLDDVSIEGTNGFSLAGLTAVAKLTSLPMPVSSGPQRISWRSAQFAALKVGPGNAEVDLQQDRQVLARIEQKTTDGAGTITVSGLRYAIFAGAVPAHVEFDRVPLQEWLEALSKGRITGEGRLSGDVDLVFQWAPRLGVDLQGGRLTSVEAGVVRFLDDAETRDLIRQQVDQIAAASGHDNVVKERLVGALEDFAYSALDFRIERDPDGAVTLRAHTSGKGRKVPQEITLDVNLRGFDAAVDTALAIKLGLDRARRRLDDKIDRTPDQPERPQGQR